MEYTYETHLVHGIPMSPFIDPRTMDELQGLVLRPDDVFIVTYPKAGTTWTQHMLKLIRNGGKDDGTRVWDAIPWLEKEGLVLESSGVRIDEMPSPRSFKSHAPYHLIPGGPPHASPARYIYVARNPKDVAVSFYYHCLAFKVFKYSGTWDHFYRLFVEGKVVCGDWFDHILEWWKHRDSPNILFLKFEDLKKDTAGGVRQVADFIGIDLKPEVVSSIAEQCTFDSMKANNTVNYSWCEGTLRKPSEPQFLRKGVVGDWRNHFTAKQNEEFDVLYAERMKDLELEFDFE